MWNRDKAIAALNGAAHDYSVGRCAEHTRQAIEAGGLELIRQACAKDYGPSLLAVRFQVVDDSGTYEAGDVGIVGAIPGHPCGHMAMFNGTIWVSDFRQMHGLYPGPAYRDAKPLYEIYRYDF